MKRISSSDSLSALMSVCPPTEEQSPRNTHMYSREFQSMLEGLDEEACGEEYGHVPEKKRRLSVDQVKALEKNFEVENKLEPERKVKLAQELGLQPRQVAVWFQNRRARWKTKQLERDYGVLKANYDSLKLNYDTLQSENDTLLKEIKELKSKLNDDNTESNISMKEPSLTESDIKPMSEPTSTTLPIPDSLARSLSFKEGPSDSDSSAILNEENNSPNAPNSSSSFRFNCTMSSSSPPSVNCCFSFSDSRDGLGPNTCQDVYQPEFVKMEEHNFFGGEEACNFFSDEQAPSLPWYSPDQFT